MLLSCYQYRKTANLYCIVSLYDDNIIDCAAEPAGWNSAAVMQWDDEAVGALRSPGLHVPETQVGACHIVTNLRTNTKI